MNYVTCAFTLNLIPYNHFFVSQIKNCCYTRYLLLPICWLQ